VATMRTAVRRRRIGHEIVEGARRRGRPMDARS
jgi:hypothetical protein